LQYGNGGIKIWIKNFVLSMKTHEAADKHNSQVDFCWEDGYRNFVKSFSSIEINNSARQAWRSGFREGVKMTLKDGIKVDPKEIVQQVWWHNLHRLKIWSTVGSHAPNGIFAVYGARMGTYMTNCTDWNYIDVRDFEVLNQLYADEVQKYERDHNSLVEEVKELGEKIRTNLGFEWPYLDEKQSKYVLDLYNETINLSLTYHMRDINV
jgi:hypothetical protein